MKELEPRAKLLLKRYLNKFKGVKFHIGLTIVFIKITSDGEIKTEPMLLSAKSTTITHKSEFNEALKAQGEGVLRQIDRFTNRGSGWTIHRITTHFMNIYKYKPLRGKSYIPLPDSIQNRKVTINIQNKNDDKCFIYCLGRRFDPNPQKDHLEKCNKHLKKTCSDLGFDQIKTPVEIKDIYKIEKQFNISINLFGHNEE